MHMNNPTVANYRCN